MPGKHVRFDDEVVFFSPQPPTPSPTLTESSLPSSAGPYTPPQQYLPPPPPLPIGPVAIHPLLAFHPYVAPTLYDVTLPPHTLAANARSSPTTLPPHILDEPATQPSMNTLTLISDMLPWRLTIHPSRHYVSVLDVFHALYPFLRQPVSAAEFKTLPSQEARDEVALAFHTRCRRSVSHEGYEEQKAKGVKRVDFLMGRNRFMGLSSTKIGPDVWVLNVA
ncbi:hypothetical protein F5I97DRAFT_1119575 [Phlebopus sp. FC_14]|nr:hypothetical protein F5I97DRAFT_1119575 [Phlebopus sp. FC_14]